MNEEHRKTNSNKGTCKYCSVVVIDQHAEVCPYCKNKNPFIPLEEAVTNLLERGYKLYA